MWPRGRGDAKREAARTRPRPVAQVAYSRARCVSAFGNRMPICGISRLVEVGRGLDPNAIRVEPFCTRCHRTRLYQRTRPGHDACNGFLDRCPSDYCRDGASCDILLPVDVLEPFLRMKPRLGVLVTVAPYPTSGNRLPGRQAFKASARPIAGEWQARSGCNAILRFNSVKSCLPASSADSSASEV